MSKVVESLAASLVESGLTSAFGVTGSGISLALITALSDLGVRYYSASHEAAAAIMAGGVCRVTGRLALSVSIKGPGLANMLPGMVHNSFENLPALSLSECYGDDAPDFQMHKRLDHASLLSSVVKGYGSLADLDDRLARLLRLSTAEVPGPVHLELCSKKTEHAASLNPGAPRSPRRTYKADEAADLFRAALRPAVIVGSLAQRRTWQEKLRFLNVPVFTTAAAKGALDELLPHSAGVFTGQGKSLAPESRLLYDCDLVIGIGLRNTEVISPRPFGRRTIILDEVDNGLADGFGADVLIADARVGLIENCLDALAEKSWGQEEVERLNGTLRSALLDDSWLPAVCFEILNNLDCKYTLVADTGSFCTIAEHIWRAGPERHFIGSNNGRYMGVALPTAIGVAIGRQRRPVFCVVGDGGVRTYPSEIKLAVSEKLPVCFVLMTDGRYGSVACASTPNRFLARAVEVPIPSWWEAVRAMGCESHRVRSAEAFADTVNSWGRTGPLFIEAVFDEDRYEKMTARLR